MPSVTKLSIEELKLTFAAEVSGIDFSKPLSDDVFEELRDAVHKYGVVVFRKACLDDDAAVALGRRFGDLDSMKVFRRAGRKGRIANDEVMDVSNLDDKNQIVTTVDPHRTASGNGNALWHADAAYNPRRHGVAILRAIELPPGGTGGETEYLDSRAAYDDLTEAMKKEIEGLVGLNSLFHNRKVANPDSPLFKDIDPTEYRMARHKVAQVHEPTGRKNIYVMSYTHSIEGRSLEDGQKLIDTLMKHCQQDKYKFTHHWENEGDMAIWDNTAVLHRATHGAYEGKYRRDMRRVSAFDMSSSAFGENDPADNWQQGLP